jgi:Spy/CpxP family protein refolding chaperone
MRPRWWSRLLLVLLVLTAAGPVYAQRNSATPPPAPFVPGLWWRDFQKNLGLSDDQSNRIEDVFQKWRASAQQKRNELEAQELEMSRLIKMDADEVLIAKQSDRVEAVRAALNKSRTLMLVHIRAILSVEQRTKLNALREQWDRDHPSSRPQNTQK